MFAFRRILSASGIAAAMPLILLPAMAAAATSVEGHTASSVESSRVPRIPNTSLPIPSTVPSSTLPTTTSTTMPVFECGDASGDGAITASDALLVLKAAIGAFDDCPLELCDADGNDTLSASDGLRILRKAVGGDVAMHCTLG